MNINEIFISLSGEPDGFDLQGGLATFVRLQGCNLSCSWCDTEHARRPMPPLIMSVEEVANQCTTKHIIITGGEPLLQLEEVTQLVDLLCSYIGQPRLVTIETNGSIPIAIDPTRSRYEFLRFVVDHKLGKSGMDKHMKPEIFEQLYSLDVIKFVIADLQDYREAKELVWKNYQWRAKKIFSPVLYGGFPKMLARTIVEDKLEGVTFALQWHKMLNLK